MPNIWLAFFVLVANQALVYWFGVNEIHQLYLDANEETKKKGEETTTGWKSKDGVEDIKAKFQDLTRRAKQEAHDGDLEESLKLYKKAYKIHKSEKVAKRIEKLEVWKVMFSNALKTINLKYRS
jgi:hypothetical protein